MNRRCYKKKTYRILEMIILLMNNQNGHWTASRLAEYFEISVRTFHRDRKAMEEMGVPLYFNRRRGSYEILDTFKFTPPELTAEEARALLLAGKDVSDDYFLYNKELKTALAKIMNSLPGYFKNEVLNNQMITFRDSPHVDLSGHKEDIKTIEKAINNRKQLKIKYFSLNSEEIKQRKLDPYDLFFSRGAMYLVAYCHLRERTLIFRTDRIMKLSTLDQEFCFPEDYCLEEYLGSAWGVERGRQMDVKLRFKGKAAYLVKEYKWHENQRIEEIAEDELLFYITTGSREELKKWILGFGSGVEVMAPEELKEEIAEEISEMNEIYE